jgi:FAD/FMN-containing dehydrogenase
LQNIKGEVVLPWDEGYGDARQEWNRRIQKFPRAIVYCEDKKDVSRCIEFARMRGVPLRVRGGGHHYEGYSIANGALVIDLSRMNAVSLEDGIVRAQGGATNAALYNAIAPTGDAFPGGACPTACLSGFTLGGGWGPSCRLLGLGCDSLAGVDLIDASGRSVSANSHCNQDLFWALRGGGGGNLGVVTGLTYRLPGIRPEAVTLVELYWPGADAFAQALFWATWQRWLESADERVTLQASICHAANAIPKSSAFQEPGGEGFAVYSRGIFFGPPEEAKQAVTMLAELPGGQAAYTPGTFSETMQRIGGDCPQYEKFKSAGRYVTRPFSPEQIARMVDTLREPPEGSVFTAYSLYALGGAVARRKPNETAFFFRDARYIAGIESVWEQDEAGEANIAWVNRSFPYLAGLTAGSYVCFPYSNLKDYMQAYYGGNANRLRRVKHLYDPCNVFCFQQSIR